MVSCVCFALSAIALGYALQLNNGFYQPAALTVVTASLVLCAVGVASLRKQSQSRFGLLCAVLGIGVATQLATVYVAPPGFYVREDADFRIFSLAVLAEGLLIAAGVLTAVQAQMRERRWRWVRRNWFPAVLAVNIALGTWMLHASPDPVIDVVTVHREAIDALLHHNDPYRVSFENIYGEDAKKFYNPAAVVGRRIAFGYPYPPVSLLFAVPGHVLAHDFRYSDVVALTLTAAFIGYLGPGIVPKLAACLLLTTPRALFVLEQGWTEPISALLLAATVFLLQKRPSLAGVAGGLFVVAKQYLALAAILLLRFAATRPRRELILIVGSGVFVAAAATLPLALWHPHAFMNDVVWLQAHEPFRADSLSYLSWAARAGWGEGSMWWAIGAAVVAMIAGVLLTPNTPAGFAASTAMYSFAMFAFGSKAFCNYYFFVIAALCSVTSARAAETCRPERARSAASEIDNHARVAVAEPVRAGKS